MLSANVRKLYVGGHTIAATKINEGWIGVERALFFN